MVKPLDTSSRSCSHRGCGRGARRRSSPATGPSLQPGALYNQGGSSFARPHLERRYHGFIAHENGVPAVTTGGSTRGAGARPREQLGSGLGSQGRRTIRTFFFSLRTPGAGRDVEFLPTTWRRGCATGATSRIWGSCTSATLGTLAVQRTGLSGRAETCGAVPASDSAGHREPREEAVGLDSARHRSQQ